MPFHPQCYENARELFKGPPSYPKTISIQNICFTNCLVWVLAMVLQGHTVMRALKRK